MQQSDLPSTKFPIPFAASAGSGFKNTIPVASQIGITNGAASLTDGFPPLNLQPVGSGGVPPFGQDMNGILFETTAWTRWQNAGGLIPWDSAFSTAISGYPKTAMLAGSTFGTIWLSSVDNNTTNPNTGGAGWIRVATSIDAQSGNFEYGIDTGSASSLAVALSPAPSAYAAGMTVNILVANKCAASPTLNINGLGAKSILKGGGNAIVPSEWLAGDIIELVYDGTNFRMVSTQHYGFEASAFQSYSTTPVTLTTADLGKFTNFNNTAAVVTLPLASACKSGTALVLFNSTPGNNLTIQTQGSDDLTIGSNGAGSGLHSFTMVNQESVMLVAFPSANNWVAINGSTQARYTPSFNSSLASFGYKRHPDPNSPTGYIIEQFGFTTTSGANTQFPVTLPTAFPNAALSIAVSVTDPAGGYGGGKVGLSLSQIQIWGSTAATTLYFHVWGY